MEEICWRRCGLRIVRLLLHVHESLLDVPDDLRYASYGEKTVVEGHATLVKDVRSFSENLFVQEKERRRSLAWKRLPWPLSAILLSGHEIAM